MGESYLHYTIASYLWNALTLFFNDREDVLAAANMNVYFDCDNPQQWFAPDVFVAFGVKSRPERRSFKLWQEPVFPQVVFEIASDRTYRNDITSKVRDYERFGAKEYYIIDTEHFLPAPLMAFGRSGDGRLQQIFPPDSKIFSARLGLEIVHRNGEVRLINPTTGEPLPTLTEAAARANEAAMKADQVQSENERLKAELARLKGEKNNL